MPVEFRFVMIRHNGLLVPTKVLIGGGAARRQLVASEEA
jgi:hypothetical protein